MSRNLVVAVLVFPAATALGGERPSSDSPVLTIRIYNYARVPADVLEGASGMAVKIYHRSGVATRWINCPTKAAEEGRYPRCLEEPLPDDIFMRIMPEASEPLVATVGRLVFGFALPSRTGGFGTAATIFWDRVAQSAELSKRVGPEALLASVMAHECGHLLLGLNSHSKRGLMSGKWDRPEFIKISEGALVFNGSEKNAIVKNVEARVRAAIRSKR